MATSKGVIQGFTGVAEADAKNQVIVEAQAHGTGSEQELLLPVVRHASASHPGHALHRRCRLPLRKQPEGAGGRTHPGANRRQSMRQRDERFKDQGKNKAKPDLLYDKAHPKKAAKRYRPQDFTLDPETGICTCPAGKQHYRIA